MDIGRMVDVVSAYCSSGPRLMAGMNVGTVGKRPEQLLEFYEFEACPFCRKVRETLSYLDLDAIVYPCPKGGRIFGPKIAADTGKMQFPYLHDPNTGKSLHESDEIIRYLFDCYGKGPPPGLYSGGATNMIALGMVSSLRSFKGLRYIPAKKPGKLLELYSFEASPYCRIVREILCSLELPYILHNVAKGSHGREAFIKRSGKMMVPYLIDPNTGKEMFESGEIKQYLLSTYAL